MKHRQVVLPVAVLLSAMAAFPPVALAQKDPLARDLATGDEVAVEAARRRLVRGPADAVPLDVCRALLRSAEPGRRLSAASVLLEHGLAADALEAWWSAEADPRALEPLIDLLPRVVAERVVRTEPRALAVDEEIALDHDRALRLRVRALGRLLDLGGVEPELWRIALASSQAGFARSAADRLVEESWPFPVALLERLDPASQSIVLDALADRPREEAYDAVGALLEAGGLSAVDRLRAMLALPSDRWPRQLVRALPDDVADADREVRALAIRLCALLEEAQAERLIAEVHRLAVERSSIADLLPALHRIGPRGERHLLGLARELSDAERTEIVDWMATRGSPVITEIVADALDGKYPLTPDLMRRSGGQLVSARRLDLVRSRLLDEDETAAMRVSAFSALVDHGVVDDAQLDFALDPDGDPRSRVRMLLSMPLDVLTAAQWQRLLADAPHDTIREVMGRMAEVPIQQGLESTLIELAATGVGLSDLAARVCLIAGRAPLAREVWNGLPADRRQHLALSLRERRDDWVLAALRATPVADGAFELPFARLVLGDRDVLDDILRDPARWPARWLRRATEDARDLLQPGDLPVLASRLADPALAAGTRRELVRWLADRPDLGGAEVLARVHETDPDEDVRYAALRGLLRRPAAAAPFRARIADAIPTGLDLDARDLGFEVIGSLEPPLDAGATLLVARLALVAPLAHPDHELRAALRRDPVADVALLNAVWQAIGRDVPVQLEVGLDAAAREAASHPNAWFAARDRLGRFLALLARTDATRAASAPVARAVLAVPDLDPGFVGPANLILAEAAEVAGEFAQAATLWERAARACLRTPPEPLLRRSFVDDLWRAEGRVPAAFLTARPHLCRARAALAVGAVEAARAHLATARSLGAGDRATLAELASIEQELPR